VLIRFSSLIATVLVVNTFPRGANVMETLARPGEQRCEVFAKSARPFEKLLPLPIAKCDQRPHFAYLSKVSPDDVAPYHSILLLPVDGFLTLSKAHE